MKHRRLSTLAGLFALSVCLQPPSVIRGEAGQETPVVLENEFLQAGILSQRGGALASLTLKPGGKELVNEPAVTESLVLPGGTRVRLDKLPFEVKAHADGQCSLSAMLPANPQLSQQTGLNEAYPYYPQDDWSVVRLDKVYDLKPGVASLGVAYTFTNTGAKPVSVCPSYVRNFLSGSEKALAVSSREGPLPLDAKHPLYSSYFSGGKEGVVETGSQAWISLALPGQKGALLNTFDPRHTSAIVVSPNSPECLGTRVELPPGKLFTTQTWIMVVEGAPSAPDGAGSGLAGSVRLNRPVRLTKADILEGRLENPEQIFGAASEEDAEMDETDGEGAEAVVPKEMAAKTGYLKGKKLEMTLALASARTCPAKVKGSVRLLPGGVPVPLGEQEIGLSAGRESALKFDFVPHTVGTWVVSFDVQDDERHLGTIEKAVEVQGPSGFFLSEPPKDRVGESFADFGRFDPFSIHRPPTLDVQVPHVRYAKPYSRGKVRAAVVIPWQIGREAVELALRMDLDMRCVFVGAHGFVWEQKLMPGKRRRAPLDEIHAMKDALNWKPQVIVLVGTPLKWFPEDVEEEIVRQVRAGAGVVICPPQEVPDAIGKLADQAKDGPFPSQGCKVATLGKGRICFMEAAGIANSYRSQVAISEFRLEQAVRATLWAANMESEVSLRMKPDKLTLDNTSQAPAAAEVELANGSAAPLAGTLELVARQDRAKDFGSVYGQSYCLGVMLSMPYALLEDVAVERQAVALAKGEARTVRVQVPPLRSGTYQVYAILKDAEGRIVNWAFVPAKVTSPYCVARFEIAKESDSPKRLWGFRPGDSLRVELALEAKADAPEGLKAFLFGEDGDDRRVISLNSPLNFKDGKASAVFKSRLDGAHRRLLVLRAGVEAAGRTLVEERRPVLVREAPGRQHKFRFVLMDNESHLPLHLTGMSDQMGPYDPVMFAWYDMIVWPVGTFLEEGNREEADRAARTVAAAAIAKEADAATPGAVEAQDEEPADELDKMVEGKEKKKPKAETGFVRKTCFNDPAFRKRKLDAIRAFACEKGLLGPQYIYFTHEYTYGSHDVCQCQHCQAAFRERMKEVHGTLEDLNMAWGTACKTWEEVLPYRVSEGLEPPPMKEWPRVIDTWQYKSTQLVNLCHEVVKAGNELSDDIDYGHIALSKMGLWVGMDFWEWSRVGSKHIMYRDVPDWQSMCGTGSTTGWHSGYGRQYSPSESQAKLWGTLVDGTWGIAHFTCGGYPLARADATFSDGAQALFDNLKEIRRGWDELLLGHDAKDGIGLYRSSPSFAVHMMEFWQARGGQGVRPDNSGDMDWERRINNILAGMVQGDRQARAHRIYHGQVLEGKLGLFGTPRIVFLCYTTAMSPREAEVLRTFVRDGGTLVGDVNVATRDWHGRPLAKPLLDDVFGVERVGEYLPAVGIMAGEGPTKIEFSDPVAEVRELRPLVVGPANLRTVGDAKAKASYELGGKRVPAYIVNPYGKGKAVYLNFLLLHTNQNNGQNWDEETGKASGALARHLAEEAGVEPFAYVTYGEKTSVRCSLGRFQDGENRYLGAIVPWGYGPAVYAACSARLNLEEPRHVYDARRGKYLGHGTAFPMEFTPDKLAAIYSLLPYKVEGVGISAPRQPGRQGQAVEFEVSIRTDGPKPGRHVVRVQVVGPDGAARDVHSHNLTVEGGKATARLHIGFNEPVGTWKLHLRDVATGVESETAFQVADL